MKIATYSVTYDIDIAFEDGEEIPQTVPLTRMLESGSISIWPKLQKADIIGCYETNQELMLIEDKKEDEINDE